MSHNIQERDTQTGLTQAWHGLTNVVDRVNYENSGIMYGMEMNQLQYLDPDGNVQKIDRYQLTATDDNLAIGNPVTEKYQMFENSQIWDMISNALSGTDHEIESIGSVNDRSICFTSVKIADNFTAANREHKPYLNIGWGHGGVMGVVAKTSIHCIVCQNTFNASMSEKSDFRVKMKHTKNANLMDLSDAIDSHIGVAAEFENALNSLGEQECSNERAGDLYLGHLLGQQADKRVTTRQANVVTRMKELFRTGKGNSGETLADCFNGLTDYYTHESSGGIEKAQKQFSSSEFGLGSRNKQMFWNALSDTDEVNRIEELGKKYRPEFLDKVGA